MSPGEQAWPTQPIPVKPPPFAAQFLDETNVTNIGKANHESALARLRKIRGGPAFQPPSFKGTIAVPGLLGGANWSGASFDPTTGLLYVNSNNLPFIITLVEAKPGKQQRYGPYRHTGYPQFRDHEGYPGIKPPWGLLNAINLNTGEFRLARAPRGISRADGPRHPANRHGKDRRHDRHRRRFSVRRRDQRRTDPRVR